MINILVVGGGTAGWITALYAKKVFPSYNIVLIESDSIGILGAGEGSTPNLVSLFDFLEIPISDLIANCHSTIKNGIKFENWNNLGNYYYHPFSINNYVSEQEDGFYYNFYEESIDVKSYVIAQNQQHSLSNFNFIEKLSDKNKVPFEFKILDTQNEIINQIDLFNSHASWAIHFDAKTLAEYLKNIGIERGILRKEGIVKKIITDSDGYIKNIKTDKEELQTDFVFDASGLHRLIIGNFYKEKWNSYSDSLPAKKAIPFFLDIEKDKINPYTHSTALDFGWSWKIPLQHRYGCGYVYDSDFISDDLANREIEKKYGNKIENPRIINFNPGSFENVWKKNCLAVGLAAGFVEPLEATSIMQTIMQLRRFFANKNNIFCKNDKNIKNFNDHYKRETEEIVDFIYLHYVTDKNNTEFWKDFTKNNKMSGFIEYILEVSKFRLINNDDDFFDKTVFKSRNYLYVLFGNGILDISKDYNYRSINVFDIEQYEKILLNQDLVSEKCIPHELFLKNMKFN